MYAFSPIFLKWKWCQKFIFFAKKNGLKDANLLLCFIFVRTTILNSSTLTKTRKMSESKIVILYVDDEENNLISFKATFRIKYKVYTAISGDEAMKILDQNNIEIIITDQRMPNMTGVEFLEKVLVKYPDTMRILLTGYTDMAAVVDAINKGKIFHYLTKPWDENELEMTINRAHEAFKEQLKIKEMNENLSTSNEQLEFLLRQKLLS